MTIETAHFSFYKITHSGYYARGDEAPLFGSTQQVLEDLYNWSKNKKLIETKISEIDESDTSSNTYLMDVQTKKNTWLITTWNETASTNGQVASVQAQSNVGNTTVHMNAVVKGSIPGYATYFWVIPDRNIFATIRFNHPYIAQKPFRSYIQKFMECYSRHVVVGKSTADSDYPILGYAFNEIDKPQKLYPRFLTAMLKKSSNKQYLIENISRITKIIRKEELDLSQTETLKLWQKLLRSAHLSNPETQPILPKITFEVPFSPTADDIENIFILSEDDHSSWDDFGVKMRGESNVYWVSHDLSKVDVDLDITRLNLEVVKGSSLISAVLDNQEKIMTTVQI